MNQLMFLYLFEKTDILLNVVFRCASVLFLFDFLLLNFWKKIKPYRDFEF